MAETLSYTFKVRTTPLSQSVTSSDNNTSLLNKNNEQATTGAWVTDGQALRVAFPLLTATTKTLTFATMGLTAGTRTNFVMWVTYAGGTTMANQHVEVELNNSGATDVVVESIGAGTATSQLEITNASGGTVDIEIVFFVRSA